jgi:hypothetical protein
VSQNKQLSTPASVDSIVSSNGQEDHVSMGANAATKAYRIVNNLYSILAIELITAAQALTFRRPLKTSPALEKMVNTFRQIVPFIEDDRILHDDIVQAEAISENTRTSGMKLKALYMALVPWGAFHLCTWRNRPIQVMANSFRLMRKEGMRSPYGNLITNRPDKPCDAGLNPCNVDWGDGTIRSNVRPACAIAYLHPAWEVS